MELFSRIKTEGVKILIHKVIAAAQPLLRKMGWELSSVDVSRRGRGFFLDQSNRSIVLEIGYWWPAGAHHLDDEPGVTLLYKESDTIEVQVPSVALKTNMKLRWKSDLDEINIHVQQLISNFEENYFNKCGDRKLLFNFVFDSYLENIGVLNEAIYFVLRKALRSEQADSIKWANEKLLLIQECFLAKTELLVFDSDLKNLRLIRSSADLAKYMKCLSD